MRLHQGMPGHDPALGERLQFAKMLLKRHRVTLIRARYAEKRQASAVSLQQPIDGDGEIRLDATVSGDRRLAELGQVRRTEVDLADLHLDMRTVNDKLSPSDQKLAARLMESMSTAEAARQASVARTTLSDQVRALRNPFEQASMKEFLK